LTARSKKVRLIFLLGVLLAVLLMGSSLSQLVLQPGSPFPSGGNPDPVRPSSSPPSGALFALPVVRGFLAMAFLAMLGLLAWRILSLANWGLIFWATVVTAALLVLVSLIPDFTLGQPVVGSTGDIGNSASPSFSYPVSPLGQPPDALVWLVSMGVVIGLAILAFASWSSRRHPAPDIDPVLREAEAAASALRSGQTIENVIIAYYQQMSRALEEGRGLARQRTMTAGEFASLLMARGIPAHPVHQLTDLFEQVRYGHHQLGTDVEQQALESLEEIIRYCQSSLGGR